MWRTHIKRSAHSASQLLNAVKSPPLFTQAIAERIDINLDLCGLDLTFGCGGHTSWLLKNFPNLRLMTSDAEHQSFLASQALQEEYGSNRLTHAFQARFSQLPEKLLSSHVQLNSLDVMFMDLGYSHIQMIDR